jgi:hypothetical protein
MEGWIFLGMLFAAGIAYGVISEKVNLPKRIELQKSIEKRQKTEKELLEQQNKRDELENDRLFKNQLIQNVNDDLKKTKNLQGNNKARTWFASMYAEVNTLLDDHKARYLRWKRHPSKKGAEIVKEVKKEKRDLNKQIKILEYQLKTYEQYFPIIEDYKDYILEDDSFLMQLDGSISTDIENYDPSQKYLKPEEFKSLPDNDKNQLALNRYLEKKHSKLEIGRFYERYIGYLYEEKGWVVKFFGIIEGFEDLGRDLICTKDNEIHIVQTKNWSKFKIIREKYLYQHFATTMHYKLENKLSKKIKVVPVFYSTIDYSDMAIKVAEALDIKIKVEKMSRNYPMIKCNINPATKEKIYHLPFDQQYDKIIIGNNSGEFYAKTVKEATSKGFRRAFRYRGPA